MPRSAFLLGCLLAGCFTTASALAAPDQLTLVSRGYDGLPGGASVASADPSSGAPSIAPDGQRVAFTSAAPNLWPGDTHGQPQAFVRDLRGGGNVLVSRADGPDGAVSDNGGVTTGLDAFAGGFSADGRSVYLAAQLPGQGFYGYRRDLDTNHTELVTRDDAGHPVVPAGPIVEAGGGRYVVFQSNQTVIPALGALPDGIYLRDLNTNDSTLVSRATGVDGAPDTDATLGLSGLSPGGRYVAFRSSATDLAPGPPAPSVPGATYVYLRDVRYGRTLLVSRADGLTGQPVTGGWGPTPVTADGCRVAFDAQGDDVAAGAPGNGGAETYVRDLCRATTTLVSRADPAHGGAAAATPTPGFADSTIYTQGMSADGRYVLFVSSATNLADGVAGASPEVYVRDLVGDRTILASRADGPGGAPDAGDDGHHASAAMTPDARFVAFASKGTNLIADDTGGHGQVYRRELGAMPAGPPVVSCGAIDDPGLAPPAAPACPGDGSGDAGGSGGDGAGLPPTPRPVPVAVPGSSPSAPAADGAVPLVATEPTLVRAPSLSAVRATSRTITAWLDLPATVDVAIAQAVTTTVRHQPRTRWRARGGVKMVVKSAGRISVRLPKLAAARYRLTVRALGVAGARSPAVTRAVDLRPKRTKK